MPTTPQRPPVPSPRGSSASVQDYVKVIYSHLEWNPAPITTTELAGRLGVTSASASEMVRRMDGMGLVRYRPYRPVALTDEGRALALAMVRRHRVLETWLVTDLGYGWDEVHEEAERLEHSVSDRLIDRIEDRLGRPRRDPHGDPIPRRDGSVDRVDARPLAAFDAGHPVLVRRISDADPAVLRRLERARIAPDTALTIGTADGPGRTVRPGGPPTGDVAPEVPLDGAEVAALWASDRGAHPGCTLVGTAPGPEVQDGASPARPVPAPPAPGPATRAR